MLTQLFIPSKYLNIYNQLINRAKQRSLEKPYEVHHIIPRSLNGTDAPENLAILTIREHYIAHLLLVKIVRGTTAKQKMTFSLSFMKQKQTTFNNRLYEKLKLAYICQPFSDEHIQNMKKPKSEEHSKNIGNAVRGKKHYTNDITGETVFCYPEFMPTSDGWRSGTSVKGTKRASYEVYHNPERTEQKHCFSVQEIPEGWVKGRLMSEKQREVSKRGICKMQEVVDNNGYISYYDPATLVEKKFKDGQEIPEGWVKGRSPNNIRRGHVQTDYQKSRAKEGKQKTYKIEFLDGRIEVIKGLSAWIKTQQNMNKGTFDYYRTNGLLWKYGIRTCTNIA